jgi:predicted MFS family arabinose efflux permease
MTQPRIDLKKPLITPDTEKTSSRANSKFSQWQNSRQTGNAARDEALTLMLLFGIGLLGEVDYQIIPPLLPLIAGDFGAQPAAAARAVPVYSLASAMFSLIFGYLSDHWGRKPFIFFGLLSFCLVSLFTRFSATLDLFFLVRFLAGMSTGAIVTSATSYAADYFSYERRGRAMGMLSTAYFAAAILGIPVATSIAGKWGWRPMFFITSVAALLCGLLVWRVIEVGTGPGTVALGAEERLSLTRIRRVLSMILRRPETLSILLASMLSSGAIVGFITFLGSHLNIELGVSVQNVGLVFLLCGLSSLLGAPLSGVVADKWAKRPLLIVSGLVLACSLATIPVLRWSLGLFGLMGLAPLLAITTELVEPSERGTFLALRNALSNIGIAAATLAASYCYQAGGYLAVGAFASGLILASTLLIIRYVKEPGGRELSPT